MSETIRIYFTDINYINLRAPDTVYKAEQFSDPQTSYSTSPNSLYVDFFAKLENFPDEYKFNKVHSAKLMIYAQSIHTYTKPAELIPTDFVVLPVRHPWDHNSLAYVHPAHKDLPWLDALSMGSKDGYNGYFDVRGNYSWAYALFLLIRYENGIVSYPVQYLFDNYENGIYVQTRGANFYINTPSYKPYIEFEVLDELCKLDLDLCSPTTGYVPKFAATTFNWSVSKGDSYEDLCYGNLSCTSVFRWRIDSEHEYTEIDCGTNLFCTVPANTFTTDNIQWQVETTDDGGHVSTSEWFSLNTQEQRPTAVAVSPQNEMIDNSKPFTMAWKHVISTGTEQTRADIQISTDGTNYTDFATIMGSDRSYLVEANSMSSGNISWRVRTYNTDGVPSDWSSPIAFINISAPPKPALSMLQFPRTEASWQSLDQQGWHFQIVQSDNVIYDSGVIFGTENTHKVQTLLNDGSYTARIRIVNRYALWSDWGVAPLNITNVSQGAITAEFTSTDIIQLTWQSETAYSEYLIYRDDIPIAKTTDTIYLDQFTVGEHRYKIIGLLNGSNYYGESNLLFAKVSIGKTMISSVDNINWIDITKAAEPLRTITTNIQYNANMVRVASAEYPDLEMTKYKTKALQLSVSFKNEDDAIPDFENLFGEIVCIKTKTGDVCIGPMLNIYVEKNEFITTYSFTIEQIHFQEEIKI